MVELNRGTVMGCMRKALARINPERSDPYLHYSYLMAYTLAELVVEGHIAKKDVLWDRTDNVFNAYSQRGPLPELLTEGYQQLLTFGYIIPQPNPPNAPNPNFFRVTDTGRQWAAGIEPVPEDSEGYFAALAVLVPNLDAVIKEYIKEALVTYERRAFFASAVMIGAASEKAVYLLMDALHGARTDPAKKRAIQKVIQERNLPTMFKRLLDAINHARTTKVIPYTVHEGADLHLLSLQEAIRVQRNDAVHPQVGQVTPETVRLALAAFPAACRKVYNLMEWFNTNRL